MKLLILGAGGHGRICGEIASAQVWEVAFLDDSGTEVGKLDDYQEKRKVYEYSFVAKGNPEMREMWTLRLKEKNYKIVTLVSGKAMVSRTSSIEECAVVMAGAVVQSEAKVGKGAIISTGAIVDHDAALGDWVHVNAGAIVPSMISVPNKTKINNGEVWINV